MGIYIIRRCDEEKESLGKGEKEIEIYFIRKCEAIVLERHGSLLGSVCRMWNWGRLVYGSEICRREGEKVILVSVELSNKLQSLNRSLSVRQNVKLTQ